MPSGLQEDARHRPVFISATGQAVLPVPCSNKERAERLAKGRFRGRPLARRASRTPFESQRHTGSGSAEASEDRVNRTGASEAVFRLRSARGWIYRLAGCPRVKSLCLAPRSCGLPPGHSLVPSAPSAVVCPVRPLRTVRSSKDIRGQQSSRTSAPRSTPQDHRGALRIGTGRM